MAVTVDSVIVELTAKVDKHNRDINSAAANFDKKMGLMSASATKMERTTSLAFAGLKTAALGFLSALSIGAVVRITKAGLDYAASLGEVAQSLGVGTKFLQEFRFAAQQNGASLEAADSALGKFSVTLGKALSGEKSAVESFTALGISIKALNAASEQQRFEMVADGIKKIADPARQSAAAIEIFGRGARDIIPTLLAGADGFREQAAAAAEYGLVLSDSDIQNADKTADKIDALTQSLQVSIAAAVAHNTEAIGILVQMLLNLANAASKALVAYQLFKSGIGRASPNVNALLQSPNGRTALMGQLAQNRDKFAAEARLRKASVSLRGGNATQADRDFIARREAIAAKSQRAIAAVRKLDLQREAEAERANAASPAGRGDATPVAGPKGPKGPDPEKAAERAAEAALRDQASIDREIYSAKTAELRARQELSTSAAERTEIERQLLDLETSQRRADIEADAAQRKKEFPLRAAQIEAETQKLLLLNDQIDHEKRALIDRETQIRLIEEQNQALEDNRDTLDVIRDLAVTTKARAEIEGQILDYADQIEKNKLEEMILSGQIVDAERARANLALRQTARRELARRDNETPLQAYRRKLSDESKDVNASIETAEVRAFESLEDSLANSVKSALHLHGVFGDLIGDLIQIAIRQLVIKQIVDAINSSEGSGGSGGGGFFSKLLSLGSAVAGASGGGKSISNKAKAGGGAVSAGQLYRVNEAGVEGFRPAQSGTIIPLGQMPNAASPSFGRQPVIVQLAVHEGALFEPRVQAISGDVSVRVVRAAAPEMVNAAVSETSRQFSRPRL